jgi:hypothetical protein
MQPPGSISFFMVNNNFLNLHKSGVHLSFVFQVGCSQFRIVTVFQVLRSVVASGKAGPVMIAQFIIKKSVFDVDRKPE